MLKILTLMEDSKSSNGALLNEHGLSLYIEYNGKRFLFDTGASDKFLVNGDRIGVDFDNLDGCIISHNHYDHGGGYIYLARRGYRLPVLYTGFDFFHMKYKIEGDNKMTVLSSGITEKILKEFTVDNVQCKDVLELTDGAWIVSGYEMINDFEQPVANFMCEKNNELVVDTFTEEVSLVFETEQGLVLVVGCSHPGIVNMLTKVKSRFQQPIYAIFGGTHLVGACDDRIEKTLDVCCHMGIKVLGMCHCTGSGAVEMIIKRKEFSSVHLAPGDMVII